MAQPPTAGAAPTAPAPADLSDAEKQRALLVQIMGLTAEQINALPPQQRDQVLQLVGRARPRSPFSARSSASPSCNCRF